MHYKARHAELDQSDPGHALNLAKGASQSRIPSVSIKFGPRLSPMRVVEIRIYHCNVSRRPDGICGAKIVGLVVPWVGA